MKIHTSTNRSWLKDTHTKCRAWNMSEHTQSHSEWKYNPPTHTPPGQLDTEKQQTTPNDTVRSFNNWRVKQLVINPIKISWRQVQPSVLKKVANSFLNWERAITLDARVGSHKEFICNHEGIIQKHDNIVPRPIWQWATSRSHSTRYRRFPLQKRSET